MIDFKTVQYTPTTGFQFNSRLHKYYFTKIFSENEEF